MMASDMIRQLIVADTSVFDGLGRLLAGLRAVLRVADGVNRAAGLHQVLRLDIVSGLGETPAAYGWHVDSLLNVRLQPASKSIAAGDERRRGPEQMPPERGISARVYRVPRTKRRPTIRVLRGGLASDAA